MSSDYGSVLAGDDARLVTFMDETYFSIFYSPRQLRQSSIAKYACNVLFVLLLGIKLKFDSVPWVTVFLPSFLSNIITLVSLKQELGFILATIGSNFAGLCRPIASLLDTFGSFVAKVIILSVLLTAKTTSKHYIAPPINWTAALSPLWILVGLSIVLRCIPYFPVNSTAAYKKKHVASMMGSTIAYVLLRGLQPLFIALRLDGELDHHLWSVIFAPSWVLTFFGLACALLIVSFAPFVDNFANTEFRNATRRLLYLLALQVLVISVTSICFLVLVTQKLDYIDDPRNGLNHDGFRVVAPLIVVFTSLILTYPLFVRYSLKYQYFIAARHLAQHQFIPPSFGLSALNNENGHSAQASIPYRKIEKITWLVQTTNSGTTFSAVDARDINHLLTPAGSTAAASTSMKDRLTQDASCEVLGQEQRIHEQLDTYADWFRPTCVSTNSSSTTTTTRSSEDTILSEKFGDIELGEIRSDSLDVDLPSPVYPSTTKQQAAKEDQHATDCVSCTMSPFLTDRAFDTGMNPCVVCMARPVNTILMSCGHAVVCLNCVLQLGKKVQTSQCPVCRAAIQSWFHLQQAPFDVFQPLQTENSLASRNNNSDRIETATQVVRLAVASREYQLIPPSSGVAVAAGDSQLETQVQSHPQVSVTIQDYQQHVPAHDALFDILFT